jgi:uncharacterized protein (DUF362 family)/Pyruvate/2-oxoacid:ferredoxin oxidoreductase delta subunit
MSTKVSIVKCGSYDSELVYEAVKKSLQDIDFEFKRNSNILLKPNVLGKHIPEEAITTHPSVIEAVCRILKEYNCNIIIGDSSSFHRRKGTLEAFKVTGIADVAEKYNAKLEAFDGSESKNVINSKGEVIKEINLAKPLFDVDLVVNLPKLKTHSLTKFTGAVKNMYGAVPGGKKQYLHAVGAKKEKFCKILVDIFQKVKPELSIMDAVVGLEGQGPGTGGSPKKVGLILTGENAFAVDIVASTVIGYKPYEILTNIEGVRRHLVNKDSIEVIGDMVKVEFKKPMDVVSKLPPFFTGIILRQTVVYPRTNKKKCTRCGICVNICPKKALTMKKYPVLNKKKCIQCYVCHENCPAAAIDLKMSMILNVLITVKRKVFKILKRK